MIKMLIVDDEVNSLEGLMTLIDWTKLGIFEVKSAINGKMALEIAKELLPDIILSDIYMPKMNGIELSEVISESFPKCKMIFITGYWEVDYLKAAFKNRVVNYILKPVNCDELISAVKKVINEINDERNLYLHVEELERHYKQSLPLLRKTFLAQLVEGQIRDIEQIETGLYEMEITFSLKGFFSIFCLKYCTDTISMASDVLPSNLINPAIIRICEKLANEQHIGYCYSNSDNNCILFISVDKSSVDDTGEIEDILYNLAVSIQNAINENLHCKITIGVGQWVENINNINDSYNHALQSATQDFFWGSNKIIFADKSSAPINIGHYVNPYDCKKIVNYIRGQNINCAIQELKSIFRRFGELRCENIVYPISACLQLFMAISQVLLESSDSNQEDLEKLHQLTERIVNCKNILEIEKILIERCEYIGYRLASQLKKDNEYIAHIKKIIEENYNESLSVDSISKEVYLSPSYACMLFKQETGKTINNYITDTRLKKAIELLENEDKKIVDICMEVGYNDPKYFSKLFKKKIGKCPNDYKTEINNHLHFNKE